jgi:hypothetical protein
MEVQDEGGCRLVSPKGQFSISKMETFHGGMECCSSHDRRAERPRERERGPNLPFYTSTKPTREGGVFMA